MFSQAIPPFDDQLQITGIKAEDIHDLEILTGRIHPELAEKIARLLGLTVGELQVWEFPNGETFAQLGKSVRNKDVFIIQPTTWADKPDGKGRFSPNDAMMELLVIIRTLKSSSVKRVTAILPYFGEGQSDKKDRPRVAILAKLWADLLVASGVDRVLCLDLHADQIQGFFNPTEVDVDHLYGSWALIPFMKEFIRDHALEDIVIASPDAGGVKRAQFVAKLFETGVAYGNKSRVDHGAAEILEVIGNVQNKNVLIWDDLINTGGTLVEFAKKLKSQGAKNIFAVATHAGLNGDAVKKLHDSPIEKVIVTDSMPLGSKEYFLDDRGKNRKTDKILCVSVARLLAQAILHIHQAKSLTDLFVQIKDN